MKTKRDGPHSAEDSEDGKDHKNARRHRQAASEAASRQRGMLTEDEGGDAERQRGTRAIPAELRR